MALYVSLEREFGHKTIFLVTNFETRVLSSKQTWVWNFFLITQVIFSVEAPAHFSNYHGKGYIVNLEQIYFL